MVEGKTTSLVIRLSDKEGIIRSKADKPFDEIINQIATLQRLNPNSLLKIYEAYWYDE